MFLLHCILFSLVLAGVANLKNSEKEKCGKPINEHGCLLRKIKWFYNRDKAICAQKFTCRNGFDYRLDCESLCIELQKETGEKGNDLLNFIYDLFNNSRTTKMIPRRTTVLARLSTKTTTKSRFTPSVTKESPTSALTRMSIVSSPSEPTLIVGTPAGTLDTISEQPSTFAAMSTVKTTSEPTLIVGTPASTISTIMDVNRKNHMYPHRGNTESTAKPKEKYGDLVTRHK